MDTVDIRERSLQEAARLGYSVRADLPLPDFDLVARDVDELVDRCLTLHALIAVSYGFPRAAANVWLAQEGLVDAASAHERRYLVDGEADDDEFYRGLSESVWALIWALEMAPELDFGKRCPDDLVTCLPDLKAAERSSSFRGRARRRSIEELAAAADLAYCLHWSVTEASLQAGRPPAPIPPWVIVERRRALEWVLSSADWDDVSLDT